MIKPIHQNSSTAYHMLDREARKAAILQVYGKYSRPLTDREVAQELGFADMNGARPRITEMIGSGVLVEAGSVKDEVTGRSVRLVRIKLQSEEKQQEFFGQSIFNEFSGVTSIAPKKGWSRCPSR